MQREGKHVLSHTAIYLVARGVPGMLSFLAIRLFTDRMRDYEYGKYNLIVNTANLFNALIFQWIRLSLVRYLHSYSDNAQDTRNFKSTLQSITITLILALGALAALVLLLPVPAVLADFAREWKPLILPVWFMLAVQALFELFCENSRALLRPWQFMWMQVARSAGNVGIGLLVLTKGVQYFPTLEHYKHIGPLTGVTIGMVIAMAIAYWKDWTGIPWKIDGEILRKIAQYGLPISLTVALASVIGTSDRYLLVIRLGKDAGESAAGLYSAGVDLTTQTLTLVLMVVNLAVFPLAVRAFEKQGKEAAQEQMRYNASLLMSVGIPCAIGMAVLAPGIAHNFLGADYRSTAASIIPLIALGAFLAGFKAYHFDAAFQFAHRTANQVWIVLVVAVLNIVLNWIAIPHWKINGAAGASVLAYVISIGLTAWLGRKHFALPFPFRQSLQVLLAGIIMGLMLFPFRQSVDKMYFIPQVIVGGLIYCGMLYSMNFMDMRSAIMSRLRKMVSPTANVENESPVDIPETELEPAAVNSLQP